MNMQRAGSASFVRAQAVSKEYFDVFGVRPTLGGPFTGEHDVQGGPDVAILSDGLWRSAFGGRPEVIGTALLLADRPYTIIGVMPPFEAFSTVDLFVPLRPGLTGPGGGFNYTVAGRLRPGVSVEQASAEAARSGALSRRRSRSPCFGRSCRPGSSRSGQPVERDPSIALCDVGSSRDAATHRLRQHRQPPARAGASARTGNRGSRRARRGPRPNHPPDADREPGDRRLRRDSRSALAYWTVPALLALTPPIPVHDDVRIDASVLAAPCARGRHRHPFGLAPAFSLSRHDLVEAFKDDGRATTASPARRLAAPSARHRGTRFACCCWSAPVCSSRPSCSLRASDPGFDPHGVLTARMSLQGERYATPGSLNRFYDDGLERLRRIPGVRSAAVVNGVPIERGLNLNVDVLDGPRSSRTS